MKLECNNCAHVCREFMDDNVGFNLTCGNIDSIYFNDRVDEDFRCRAYKCDNEEESEFKPCPFCGWRFVELNPCNWNDIYVSCELCGLQTRLFHNEDAAIQYWNTRSDAK